MSNNITPPPSPRTSHPGATLAHSKSPKTASKMSHDYNKVKMSNPPRAHNTTSPLPHYQTRWEREKAKARAEGIDIEGSDPRMIGPWILGEMLGKGASGRVRLARHRVSGKLAAVKILNVPAVMPEAATHPKERERSEKMLLSAEREIAVMKLLDHPNIIKMYDVWSSSKELYLVLEYVQGGELFDYLCSRGSRLHIVEAISIIKQILSGVHYCHTFNICHRDLKPENILLTSSSNTSSQSKRVKIADFGMSNIDSLNGFLRTSCGSPHYASPEIVRGEAYHGARSDIWSCGVILYALITSRLPFDDANVNNVLKKVRDGRFTIPDWVIPEAKDLLVRMLEVNTDKRISLRDIFRHPLLRIETPGIPLSPIPTVDHYTLDVSRDDIDPDLLRSLCIILRENKKSLIIERLCCQEKSFEKAFYFLLCRYRDRSFEEYNVENHPPSISSASIALVTPPLTPRYDAITLDTDFPFKRHYPGRASPPQKNPFGPVTGTHQPPSSKQPRRANERKATDPLESKNSTRVIRTRTQDTLIQQCHSVRPTSPYKTSRRRSGSNKTSPAIDQSNDPKKLQSYRGNGASGLQKGRFSTSVVSSVERTAATFTNGRVERRITLNRSRATPLPNTLSSKSFTPTSRVVQPPKASRSTTTNETMQGQLSLTQLLKSHHISSSPFTSILSQSHDYNTPIGIKATTVAAMGSNNRYPRSKTDSNVNGLGVYVRTAPSREKDGVDEPTAPSPTSGDIHGNSSDDTWEQVEVDVDTSLQDASANVLPRRTKRKPPPLDLQNPFSRERRFIASATTTSEAPKHMTSPLLSPLMNFVGFSKSTSHSNPSSPEKASPLFSGSPSHQSISNSASARNVFARFLDWKTPSLVIAANGTPEAIGNECLRLFKALNIAYSILDSNTIRCHAAESGPNAPKAIRFRVIIGIMSPRSRVAKKTDIPNLPTTTTPRKFIRNVDNSEGEQERDSTCYTLSFILEKGSYPLLKSIHERMCQAWRLNTSVDMELPPTPLTAGTKEFSLCTRQLFPSGATHQVESAC